MPCSLCLCSRKSIPSTHIMVRYITACTCIDSLNSCEPRPPTKSTYYLTHLVVPVRQSYVGVFFGNIRVNCHMQGSHGVFVSYNSFIHYITLHSLHLCPIMMKIFYLPCHLTASLAHIQGCQGKNRGGPAPFVNNCYCRPCTPQQPPSERRNFPCGGKGA
jgi:hypothetical protein